MRPILVLATVLAASTAPFVALHQARSASAAETSRPTEVLDGVIQPFETVLVNVATEGVLAEVTVGRGDVVRTGDLLARLEASVEEESAELARLRAEADSEQRIAEVKLAAARAKLEKRSSLVEEGIITTEELAEVETEVALAELELLATQEASQQALVEHQKAAAVVERMTLRSPIDGVVLERHHAAGELVTRSEEGAVFSIASLDPLLVEVHAPVTWLGRVAVGDRAAVEPQVPVTAGAGLPVQDLVATIRVIDQVANPASETVRVQLELPNPEGRLPAGLRCKVHLTD